MGLKHNKEELIQEFIKTSAKEMIEPENVA